MAIISRGGGEGGGAGGQTDAAGGGAAEVLSNLPPRTGPVCGRKPEMQAVVEVLNAALSAREPAVVEISGARGTGASTVAVELARRAGASFPGGAWILRAGLGADLAWAEIAAARGESRTTDLKATAARERERLTEEPKSLLVVDGAASDDDLADLIPQAGPTAADVFVVTEKPTGRYEGVVEVRPVPEHAPRRIAHSVLRVREGDDVTPPTVRACDGLAVTASLAARAAVAYYPNGAARSVRDLREAVVGLIPLFQNSQPICLEILLIGAVAHPTLIAVDALYGAVHSLRSSRGGELKADDLSNGVLHLVRLGLLELDEESRISMHPLVQDVFRGMAQSEADIEVARTALAHGLIAEVDEAMHEDGVDVPRAGLHQLRHLLPDAPEAVRSGVPGNATSTIEPDERGNTRWPAPTSRR